MKKISSRFISLLLVLVSVFTVGFSLSACSNKKESDKISIAVTIFPIYDWVMQVLGENADKFEVTMLLTSGADLHNYQPTADDIVTISSCDMFVYVGGHSDGWVDATLNVASNIIIIDGSDGKIANTVINTTASKNAEVLTLNSIQSITSADLENGASYFEIMQSNLRVLTTALN